jgi:predicted TIM-barrel fold metal-dependent hydrolase
MIEDHDPVRRAPPGACDVHFHVFGPADRYPARDPKLRYVPPLAPLDAYLKTAARIGIERFVIVQPSAYGRDNACMLDAMAELGERARGIVDVDEDAPDALLDDLHARGVRGVRINVSPIHPFEAGLAERMLPRIDRMERRCADRGWSLDFLLPGWLTDALLPRLARLEVDHTLAHLGMFLAKDGPSQPGFRRLVEQVANGAGRTWVKLTGFYRISRASGYADVEPMIRALVDARVDRLVWGSDDPHLSFSHETGSVSLYDLFCRAAGDAALRTILVDNPARLYGFAPVGSPA